MWGRKDRRFYIQILRIPQKGGFCMANVNGNLEFKSDVFSMLMQDKRRALEVYNAINGTAYADPDVYN